MAVERIVRLSTQAENDLEKIWIYTKDTWSLQQAETYHSLLAVALHDLAANIKIGRAVNIRKGYLKYPVGSHVLFYMMTERYMDVIRVLHQRMDIDRHLN